MGDRLSPRGSLVFDPLAPVQLDDPYPVYARLRRDSPVHYEPRFDLYVITRYDDVVAAALQPESLSSQDALRSSLEDPSEVTAILAGGIGSEIWITASDDPDHGRVRGLINKVFTPRRVRELEPDIERLVYALIDEFAEDGEAELIEQFAWPLPLQVLAQILGLPQTDLGQLHVWSYDFLRLLQGTGTLEERMTYARHFVAFQRYMLDALRDREASPRDDFLTALLDARRQADPPLSIVETAWIPITLVTAGHVTVTRAIGNGLAMLFKQPDLRALVATGDGKEISDVVEEVLRYESPAQGLFRTAKRDIELSGTVIPKGARVMVHFGSANRDEAAFAHPDQIVPGRPDAHRHLAFGKGIHYCVGAPLARMELVHAFRGLVRRLPNLGPAAPPERDTIFFARGFLRMPVRWDTNDDG